jgi:hypothetical protein
MRSRSTVSLALTMLMNLVCMNFGLLAQQDRGNITGIVKDPSGAAVVGAKITVTKTDTNVAVSTVSTETGDYNVLSLTAGAYSVRVEREGFKAAVAKEIILVAGGTARVDATLEIGTAQQVVEVETQGAILQTESAKVSTQVNNKLIEDLPLVVSGQVRSPFDLAALAPETKNFGDTGFAIGGGQAAGFNMALDGISATTGRALQTSWATVNTPSVDAIGEFTVETNGFKPEYSRAGGGTMTFVSKSGTNEFHGSAYAFIRNEALDARRFTEVRKGLFRQQDFGYTAGGPIWIPKLYNGKNRTFFFVAGEYFRNQTAPNPNPLSVAPEAFYNGNFTNWVTATGARIPIYDPATTRTVNTQLVRDVFPNNQIPQNRFDPSSVRVSPLGKLALPNINSAAGSSGFVRNNRAQVGSIRAPWDKFSFKGDHVLSEKQRISGYYGYNTRSTTGGADGPPGLPGIINGENLNSTISDVYRFSHDWTVSANKLNRFYAGANNWRETNKALAAESQDWTSQYGMRNVPNPADNIPQINFGGEFAQWGGPSRNGSENITIGLNDDFSWIKNNHTFKVGYQYEQVRYFGFGQQNLSGFYQFTRAATAIPGDQNPNTSGSAFASFLLGHVNNANIHTPRFIDQVFDYHGMYFQDDWRITRNLTINYGARYEVNRPPFELDDEYSDFCPTCPNPGANGRLGALVFAGNGPGRLGRRRIPDTWWGAIGPRFGFAFSPNERTVIRGGVGRSFNAVRAVGGSAHILGFALIQDFPDPQAGNGTVGAFRFNDGLPNYVRPPFLDPSFGNFNSVDWWQGNEVSRAPEYINYSLNIQRNITANSLFEIGYSASTGSHLQAGLLNYNQPNWEALPASLSPFANGGRNPLLTARIDSTLAASAGIGKPFANFPNTQTVAQALRPYPQYFTINTGGGQGDRSGSSTYHALVTKYERRYSGGLTFLASYAFSKLLTNADSYWIGGAAMDHYKRGLEKSIGQFDQTHNFKFSYSYELPFGKGRRYLNIGGPANIVLGGWRLSGIHLYASGAPIGLGTSINFQNSFYGGNRPTVSTYDGWLTKEAAGGPGGFNPSVDRFFPDATAFGVQPTDRLGNATRYNPSARFFPNLQENYSFAKTFAGGERFRADFRAEVFNLLNRAIAGPLANATVLQQPNFGLWRIQANDPRRLQLGLKLYF